MNRNGRSVWHGGGTRTPSGRERGGSASGIRLRRAIGLVPYRATSSSNGREKILIRRCSVRPWGCSGTKWHACPRESAREHGRA